jgi:hypothetical protein
MREERFSSFAHARIEQRQKIGDTVGDRHIERIARGCGVGLDRQPAGRGCLRVSGLGQRNDLGENIDLFFETWPAAEEHVDDLVEIVQPERQLDVARVEHLRLGAETAAIFVVHVEKKHAQIRPCGEDQMQQQCHALDLPTPVVPSTAKCLLSISSMSRRAGIVVSC